MKRYKHVWKRRIALVVIVGFMSFVPTMQERMQDWTKMLRLDFIVYGQTGTTASGSTYLPQIADGGGYSTTFTFLNTTGSPVTGRLRLFNEDGTAKALRMNGITDSQFSVTVPANGSVRLTTPNSGNDVGIGWAAFESTPRLQAVATFDFRPSGVLLTTAGVVGTAGAARYVVPIDFSNPLASTGIAIANVQSTSSITLRLRLYNESGVEVTNVLDPRLNPLGPQKHIAGFIEGFFGNLPSSFKGTLAVEVVGSGIAAVTGLSLKEGLLSTVPVIETASTSSPPVVSPAPTLASMNPGSGNVGATVTVTMTGTNFVGGGTTVSITGSGITVGTVQVSGSTSLTTTFTIASTAAAGNRIVTVTTNGGTSNGLTFSITVTASKSFNQTQAERLAGTWVFTYTIISTFTDTYRLSLSLVQQSTSTPGEWFIGGFNISNGIVVAGWSSSLSKFFLLSPGTLIDDFFVFDLTSDTTANGCYYLISPHGSTNLSSCFQMTGVRTSTNAITENASSDAGTRLQIEKGSKAEVEQIQRTEGTTLGNTDQDLIETLGILQEKQRSNRVIR